MIAAAPPPPTTTTPPSPPPAAAEGRAEEDAEDYIASPPGLWLPRTVVKRHRKKATIIWISLLAVFFAYVGYTVWESMKARINPATSIMVKQKQFKFPDVGVCVGFLNGCLSTSNCLGDWDSGWNLILTSQLGFMEIPHEFELTDFPEVVRVMEAYPTCRVMPLSRLTVNETAVNSGDVNSFTASFSMLWVEDPLREYDATKYPLNTQSVGVHFIDVDQDVDQIGEKGVADVKVPYERVNFTQGEWTALTENYMVLSLSEFSGITETGARLEVAKTFKQSTTSSRLNWLWPTASIPFEVSFLEITMTIPKFEFTSIEEVDPVDVWTIIGAIGGGWQLVVLAFGVFVAFSEKQPPDRKMRSFYKPASTSTVTADKRLSHQDIELDATGEDLPTGWIKTQRKDGSVYYLNVMTGSTRANSPNEQDEASESTGGPSIAPPGPTAVHPNVRVANNSQACDSSTSQEAAHGMKISARYGNGDHLPPGWISRTNGEGRAYYTDTDRKITKWERPAWRTPSTGSTGVQAADTAMAHTRRGSNSSSTRSQTPFTELPSKHSRCHRANPAMDTPCVAPGASATTAGAVVVDVLRPPVR